ncbi:MAG: arylsulfatase A-like enzyme [Planctomycetota bacterium]|jgi:arylsulfatase A-like enzyme
MRVSLSSGAIRINALLLLLNASCSPPIEPPQHVLLVVIDTLRASHLTSYGYARPTSPHIDQLAKRGARFTRATSQSSWTAPSMVSMFTGRHILEERLSIPEELPSLPELFSKAGYRTGAFVVNPILHNEENGFRRGFDHFVPDADFREISQWIARSAQRPTLTWVHWVDPHDPYGPAPEYEHFIKLGGELPAELDDYYQSVTRTDELQNDDSSRTTIRRAVDGYDDDIRLVDSKLDILTRALDQAGLYDRSVIVIASDHGEGLWAHRNYPVGETQAEPPTLLNTHKMTHGNHLYQELVHVPIILFGAGVPEGIEIDSPVENVDILPTLLELCDLPIPSGITGTSLLPILKDSRSQPADFAVSATRWVQSIQSHDGWKLILPTEKGRGIGLETELFALNQDPNERTNLAATEIETVKRLSKLLTDRLATGLRSDGEGELSGANLKALQDLGYVE